MPQTKYRSGPDRPQLTSNTALGVDWVEWAQDVEDELLEAAHHTRQQIRQQRLQHRQQRAASRG